MDAAHEITSRGTAAIHNVLRVAERLLIQSKYFTEQAYAGRNQCSFFNYCDKLD